MEDDPFDRSSAVRYNNKIISGRIKDFYKFSEKYPIVEYPIDPLEKMCIICAYRKIIKTEDEHEERINKADLSYPILVAVEGDELFAIIDGNHRIAKAVRLNHKTIKTRLLPLEDLYNYFKHDTSTS